MTERKVWVKSTALKSNAFRVTIKEGDLIDDLKKAIVHEKKLPYGSDLLEIIQSPEVVFEVDEEVQFSSTGVGETKQRPYYFVEPRARRRSILGRFYDFWFGSSVPVVTSNLATADMIVDIQDSININNQYINMLIVDMSKIEVASSVTDREIHHVQFEQEIVRQYQCEDLINHPNKLRCVVTNQFHPVKFVSRGAHLIALAQRSKLSIIGIGSSEVWNWRNGICMHKQIAKRFELLELTFKYDYLDDTIRVQILYDDLLTTYIPGMTLGHLNGTNDTAPATFGYIDQRELSLPIGVRPYRRVLLFVAYSAYAMALASSRPHLIATNSSYTAEEWNEMFERSHSEVPTESPLMRRFRSEMGINL